MVTYRINQVFANLYSPEAKSRFVTNLVEKDLHVNLPKQITDTETLDDFLSDPTEQAGVLRTIYGVSRFSNPEQAQ